MSIDKINKVNFVPTKLPTKVPAEKVNEIIDLLNTSLPSGVPATDTITELTAGAGVTVDGVKLKDSGISLNSKVTEYTTEITLSAAQIVGTTAGTVGHTNGAPLVAALGTAYALEFVSAVCIFDYATAAYTGGGNDQVIRVGTVAVSSALTKTECLNAAGDKVKRLGAIGTEITLGVNSSINFFVTTEVTQPGTAAGVLRIQLTYRVHTTSL